MAGVGDPILVAPLLQALAADADEDVRFQVARVLQQDFLEEPGVREALDYARASDPSATVRKEINFAMLDAAGQTESLKATVLNTSLSAWDRTAAFSQLLDDDWNAPNDIDAEVVDAMVQVTLNTPTPRARVFALSSLVRSRSDDPRFLDLYLTALERDRDETVRQTAVNGLSQFINDPAIREALEQAMANDSSPYIRKTIADTLRWEQERDPAAAAATIMKPAAAEQDKAAAWGMIHASAADYWTDSIVAEATRIGMTSTDPNVRAAIWRHARATRTHPLLLQPLLQALASDPDGNVRAAAARTLDQYLDETGVREALESAAQYDPDAEVRQRAEASLADPQGDF
jgi:HEAT repeat protein